MTNDTIKISDLSIKEIVVDECMSQEIDRYKTIAHIPGSQPVFMNIRGEMTVEDTISEEDRLIHMLICVYINKNNRLLDVIDDTWHRVLLLWLIEQQ